MAFVDFVPSEVARVTLFTAIVSLIFSVVVKRFANKYWIWFYWNVLKCGRGKDRQYLWMCTGTRNGCPTQLFASYEATFYMQTLARGKAQCPRCRGSYMFIGKANSEVGPDDLAANEFILQYILQYGVDKQKTKKKFNQLTENVQAAIRKWVEDFTGTLATISEQTEQLYDPDLLLRF